MKYDIVKDKFARIIELFPTTRKVFYLFLDLILLRQKYVKKEISKLYPVGTSINFYDAGAGFCQYSDYVLKRYPNSNVLAVDIKTDYVESFKFYAENNHKGKFIVEQADLQNYISNDKYDLAIAIDILEHIEDDRAVLANFFQSMNKGSRLIISSPSNFDEAAAFTEEHVRPGYAKDELENKVTTAGFSILESYYSYGKWGKKAWIMGMKKPISMAGKGILGMICASIWMLITYPLVYLFMKLDMNSNNKIGNGLIVVAEKR